MFRALVGRRLLLGSVVLLALAAQAPPQAIAPPRAKTRLGPRLEPVAETRLLMQGLNLPNFRGLERHLKQKPAADDAWIFARGQALLIAENANLLLLRPPRNPGESAWMDQASELRTVATRLARAIADRDYERSRAGLTELAQVCNGCHQTFRVGVRLTPFAEP